MHKFTGHPSEHNEQAAFVNTVQLTMRHRSDFIPEMFFAVPNGMMLGGKNPAARAALMNKYKTEGFRNGVSDLLYLQPRGEYAFLAIEMKTPDRANQKNGGATQDQLDWLKAARSAGAMAELCHGAEAAWEIFQQYMSLDARPNPYHEGV